MEEGIECSSAQVYLESVTDFEVNLVAPARLALEEPENNKVKMVLHQSLSPRLIQILIQAAPKPFETYNPQTIALNAFYVFIEQTRDLPVQLSSTVFDLLPKPLAEAVKE